VDDGQTLTELNARFIEAFRQGSWELLAPILSPSFAYLDGATGETWAHDRYVENLRGNPAPSLEIDQVVVHVDGNTAVVSARTSRAPGRYRRYVDTYERRGDGWLCVHACVWPLAAT
jgi:ketosteroid isomerase-like protein